MDASSSSGAGMGGDSIGGVCLDIAEEVDAVNRTKGRQWGSARGAWELRCDAHHEPSNEATVLHGIK